MLRTFAVALLAIAMSVGLAQAKMHKHIPGCIVASQRLQHVSVVSHLPVNQCCARRGNGVFGNGVSARRKAFYTDKGGKQLTQGPPLAGRPHFVLCASNVPPLPAALVCRGAASVTISRPFISCPTS